MTIRTVAALDGSLALGSLLHQQFELPSALDRENPTVVEENVEADKERRERPDAEQQPRDACRERSKERNIGMNLLSN